MMTLIKMREKVDDLLTDLKSAEKTCNNERQKLIDAEDYLTFAQEAQQEAQYIAEQVQEIAHKQISGVVTRCLQTVFFDEDYGFYIRFDKKRGKTDAVLILTKDGHEIENPLDYDSGAVCEMAAFTCRISCLVLSKPELRKLLLLDEPFKSMSAEYWENTRLLLEGLSEEYEIQIVMVTHNKHLRAGKVVEL